jgi:CYTH domain-containing protein
MAIEIEKKFLVKGKDWKEGSRSKVYYQGYLCSGSGQTVRVRIAGENALITIKGRSTNISRLEFEYPIPLEDSRILLDEVCQQPIIHKRRFFKEHKGFTWEIDEFYGENQGLVLAEIELESEDQQFARPEWLGEEVSHDGRYYNASLRTYPYSMWKDDEKND